MPTETYKPLANVTLGTAVATVTFSSIPATYRDLVVIVQGNTSITSQVRMVINSDTGNNYNWQRLSGNGTTDTSLFSSNVAFVNLANIANATSSSAIQIVINVMDYSATDKHKTVLSRAGNAANGTDAIYTRWANTAAITSLQVAASSGNWAIGSTFALYGIAA
jgi:hypothetical protein